MTTQELIDGIKELKEERNAVIMGHNYMVPEVQDIADYLGDSLGLSHQAAETKADRVLWRALYGRDGFYYFPG